MIVSTHIFSVYAQPQHIFVEINDILFRIQEQEIAQHFISQEKVAYYKALFFKSIQDIKLNNTEMESVSTHTHNDFIDNTAPRYQGYVLPHFMNLYFKEKLTEADKTSLMSIAEKHIAQYVDSHKNLYWFEKPLLKPIFYKLLKSMINDQDQALRMVPNYEIFSLFEQCSLQTDNHIYILSNKTRAVAEMLNRKYENSLSNISQKPLKISGVTQRIKPSKPLYEYLIAQTGAPASACYLIDTDPESIRIGNACHMNTFLYKGNIQDLSDTLKKWNLLTP
jgi:FMN phosphatase YigB (HAD superfamily)